MNWDSPEERFALIERVGIEEYNRQITAHLNALPSIYPVQSRFGTLWAVKGTTSAFSTREAAEQFQLLAEISEGRTAHERR